MYLWTAVNKNVPLGRGRGTLELDHGVTGPELLLQLFVFYFAPHNSPCRYEIYPAIIHSPDGADVV